ncbi:ABC transporter substrate-binding protein [Rubrimonas sp.]|uniref:ABC transporter substrate-binding protein n=1 Tax=Rubrimonas sp. TaxID=2036015 RepID=UPI002FDDBF30
MHNRIDRRQVVRGLGAGVAATALGAPYIAKAATTKIVYWAWSEHVRGANALYPMFREMHPDIEVDIVNLNPQEIQDKILIAMATGVGAPDVGLIIEARFPTYPPTGGLADVTDHIAGLEDQYEPRLWERLHYNGRAFGMPYINNSAVMFYRRDIMERIGLSAPPDTWPEWIEAGRRVRALGEDIYMHQVSAGVPGNGPLMAYMESAGVQYFGQDGRTIRNNEKATQQLKFYHDIVHEHDIALLVRHNSPEHFVAIKTGKLAALHSGNWGLDRLEQEAADDFGKWGAAPWPRWSADAPPWTGTWGGSVLSIPRSGRNVDAAIEWAKFLGTNVEAQVGLWLNSYGYPANLRARQDPRLREINPFLGESMYESSLAPRETQYMNLVPDWPRIQVAMGRELDLMLGSGKAPERAWADFEAEMIGFYG